MTQSKGINEQIWEFPCRHNLKVMGASHHPMCEIVSEIIQHYVDADDFDPNGVRTRESRNGRYVSVTASVMLRNKEQVESIYRELHEREEVSFTL